MNVMETIREWQKRKQAVAKESHKQKAQLRANSLIQFKEYDGSLYIAVDNVPLIPSDLIKTYNYKADEKEMCEALNKIRATAAAYIQKHNVNIEL